MTEPVVAAKDLARAPAQKTLDQSKADFTAEGAPPPGTVPAPEPGSPAGGGATGVGPVVNVPSALSPDTAAPNPPLAKTLDQSKADVTAVSRAPGRRPPWARQ